MLLKLFIGFIILAAIVGGTLALTLRPDQILGLVRFRDFFEFALPVLAFGALIKYLCACSKNNHID